MLRQKTQRWILAAAVGAWAVASLAGVAEEAAGPEGYRSVASLPAGAASLVRLHGCWKGKSPSGAAAEVSYELDESGMTLMEKFHAEGELPRLALYEVDAEPLLAHSFCNCGSQVRLEAEPAAEPGVLRFRFLDAVGDAPVLPEQLTETKFTFRDLDRFEVEQRFGRGGESASRFFLFRRVFEGCGPRQRSGDW